MQLSCPHCGYSKEVADTAIPERVNKVTCPRCKSSFPLQRPASPVEADSNLEKVEIPAPAAVSASVPDPKTVPKAGFWIRFVAAILDGVLVLILQGILGGLLFWAGMLNGSSNEGLAMLVQIFAYLLSFVYYIFFTGYCGQTPGKMALRVKVIRCDGTDLTYGRAAFREVPAKFISGIIFCIGYLMIVFDEQKQGLHDRMADTYVIKL